MAAQTTGVNAKARAYFGTVGKGHWKKTVEQVEQEFVDIVKKVNAFGVLQVEQGKSQGKSGLAGAVPDHNGVHLHFYIYLKNPRAQAGIYKLFKPIFRKKFWLVKAENNKGAIEYCSKDETRVRDTIWVNKEKMPMEHGVKRTLTDACEMVRNGGGIKRVAREMPEQFVRYHGGLTKLEHQLKGDNLPRKRDVKVFYVWGDSGCGKSHFGEFYDTAEETYATGDMKEKIWFGQYGGQRTLVIEEFEGKCWPQEMKRLLDGWKMEVQTKGGFCWAEWTTVIVTSNFPPESQYDVKDNWFSVPPTPKGPFQRRFMTGGIHHGTGSYEDGTAVFDPPLPPIHGEPIKVEDMGVGPDTVRVEEILKFGHAADSPIELGSEEEEEVDPELLVPASPGVMEEWRNEGKGAEKEWWELSEDEGEKEDDYSMLFD